MASPICTGSGTGACSCQAGSPSPAQPQGTEPEPAGPARLTAEDARESLASHAQLKGRQLREKYGPDLAWETLERILEDREFVRYPCRVVFGAESLQPGEFAYPQPLGERPEDGFLLSVHPAFASRREQALGLVLYQLAAVNYGEFASAADAEAFGAAALGLSADAYYEQLCQLADELAPFRG